MTIPLSAAGDPLCLLQVHAHPDDEASKGSAAAARYAAEGVRTVLVTCTGGEAGDILNPAMDSPEVRGNLAAVRLLELQESVRILNYTALHLLGYHDSGMADTETNKRPDNFHNAPLDEAIGKLVAIIRQERPQVIVTYGDDSKFYPHPDHIRVHEISLAAFDAAGDADLYRGAGEPFQPSKMYYTGFSPQRIKILHQMYIDRGEESPFQRWFERDYPAELVNAFTTLVPVGDFLEKRTEALLAHRTQVDPTGRWFQTGDDVLRQVFPYEEFVPAKSLVSNGVAEGEIERDLFAGVRAVPLTRTSV